MTTTAIVLIAFLVLYLGFVGYLYGRQRRWLGFLGWAMFMTGALLAFSGGGEAFPWAGLLWAFIGLFGLITVAVDVAAVRRRRRRGVRDA